MGEEIEVIEPGLFAGTVADELVAAISEFVAEKGSCSLVLSGGTTPGAVYRSLSSPPRVSEVLWRNVTLFLGDERWVPPDDPQANGRMVRETLLEPVGQEGAQFFPVDTTLASPSEAASAYAKSIQAHLGVQNEQFPQFDVVLLGLGEDGHFASVFPGSPLIESYVAGGSSGVCAATLNTNDHSQRISLTPEVLFNARRVYFLVTGRAKSEVVKRVIFGKESPTVLPARLWSTAKARVTWFLDSAAALSLDKR